MFKQKTEKISIYIPRQRLKTGFIKSFLIFIYDIYTSRELIFQLVKRDFLGAYKKSFFGFTSYFINPIIGIISWVFMNMTGIINPGDVGIPYPVYILFSTTIWSLFTGFYSSGATTLNAGEGFIMQVKFPHEALLVKQILLQLINFIIPFVLNIIVLLIFGIVPNWKIVFFPIFIIPLFFLGAGIGLMQAIFNVVAKEIAAMINICFGFLIYITPIIYSPKQDNEILKQVIKWNPLTYLIGITRDLIIYGKLENFDRYIYSVIFALLIFIFSWRLFFISEDKIIEKMI